MEMKTIMTKESNFVLDETKREEWMGQAMELLNKYLYNPTEEAVGKIFDKWAEAKGWFIDLFRKSKDYNGNGQIIIPANLKRPINRDGIDEFKSWALYRYRDMMAKANEIYIGMFTYDEYETMICKMRDIAYSLPDGAVYNGLTKLGYLAEVIRMQNRREETKRKYPEGIRMFYIEGRAVSVPFGVYRKVCNFEYFLGHILNTSADEPWLFNEAKVNRVTEYCEELGIKARPVVGQKVTKYIGKVLKELGMNKIVDIQTQTWISNGVEMSREKDMGYNYYFALLGDSINPLEYTKEIVISVNPIDYWTMSFGYKWASCHTIDKDDFRNVRENQHGGCYSGGTESYMFDESTFIVYVRPTEKEIESVNEQYLPMESQSKFKRVLFYLGEDKLVQSRVYPDGRDGGDEGLAGQLRAIIQKVIADLYETPNMWTLQRGTTACGEAINTISGIHYDDYNNYDDCNVSYLRRIDGHLNHNTINVGVRKIICPSCGEEHNRSEHITCNSCYENNNGHICSRCGETFREDNDSVEARDRYGDTVYFCSRDCAYDAGYEYTEDAGWVYDDGLYYDSWSEEYYVYGGDGIWCGDEWFHSEYNANQAGYRYADVDEEWAWHEDVAETVDGRTFIYDNWDAVRTSEGYYLSAEEAEENGWSTNDDGEYVRVA